MCIIDVLWPLNPWKTTRAVVDYLLAYMTCYAFAYQYH